MASGENSKTRKLLFVFAHPDDETFNTGGTIALYARNGVEVHLICATRGEAGEAPPDRRGYASVGEMRAAGLECAARVLGIRTVHFLEYRDSGVPGSSDNSHPRAFASQPVEQVAREIALIIRQVQPQVVVTYDPIGGYMHPDQIAAHKATVRAFPMAADASVLEGLAPHAAQRLYYHTFSRRFLRLSIRLMPLLGKDPARAGMNKDLDLTRIASVDFPIHARIQVSSVAEIKAEAIQCHFSQSGGMSARSRIMQRIFDRTETYMRAIPKIPPTRLERDLFEGIA